MKKKQLFALLLAAAVVFVALFSTFFIAAESNHICTGESCVICSGIALCKNILSGFPGGPAVFALKAAAIITVSAVIILCGKELLRVTPVLLKVKLSD